jgi:MFS family permease
LAVGPEGLGILRASPSIGAAFTALIMGFSRPGKSAGKLLMACVFGYGLTTIGFGVSTNFWFSLIMLFVGGMLDGVSVVIRSTILQLATPDAMRGRVSAINTLFVGSSNEIGALESGTAAKLMGLVPSVVFGGVMCCAIVLGIGWRYPYLYRLNMNKLV